MTMLDIFAPELFDCKKTYRSSCEAIGCEGGLNLIEYSFNQWYGKEIFYFVGRKELEKWLCCKVNENRKICGFCEGCETCTRIQHIRMRLDDAYYFKLRKDAPFQPICWKVYFSAVHSLKNFKIDIARTRERTTIHWHKE